MMKKKTVIEFKLEDDAITYGLVFDFNELADAEAKTGLNLLAAMRNLDGMSAGQMRGLLYALLKPVNQEVELKEAGELLGRPDRKTVTDAMWKTLGVKSEDETLLEALQRLANQAPDVFAAMLAKIGASFEVAKQE